MRAANRLQGNGDSLLSIVLSSRISILAVNHQARYLEENFNITITDATLRNWQKILINHNWIAKDKDKVKYVLCRKGESPREMTEEQYKKAWHKYFALVGTGVSRSDSLHTIYLKNGGMPRKQIGFTENALESAKLQELRNILENFN